MTARGPRSGREGNKRGCAGAGGCRGVPGGCGARPPGGVGDTEDAGWHRPPAGHRGSARPPAGLGRGRGGRGAGAVPPELARIVLGQDLPRTRCFVLGLAAPAAAPTRGWGARGGPAASGLGARGGGVTAPPWGGGLEVGGSWHHHGAGGSGGSEADGAGGAVSPGRGWGFGGVMAPGRGGGHRAGGHGHRAGAAPAPGLCPQEQSSMAWGRGRGTRGTVPGGTPPPPRDTVLPSRQHRRGPGPVAPVVL